MTHSTVNISFAVYTALLTLLFNFLTYTLKKLMSNRTLDTKEMLKIKYWIIGEDEHYVVSQYFISQAPITSSLSATCTYSGNNRLQAFFSVQKLAI